jgi:acetylglutamate kinase
MTNAIVVKLGGDVLEHPTVMGVAQSLAHAVKNAADTRFVVVHGGGAQATELSQKLGLQTQTIAGRRVTDEATLDVLKMVVAGQLNVGLCAVFSQHGLAPVGLHAGSGVVRAERRPARVISGGPPTAVDLGLVGDIVSFDSPLLEALWAAQRIPVLSCLGMSPSNFGILNCNADLVASRLAVALGSSALVAVTGVGGVRSVASDPNSRLPRLSVAQAQQAIAQGTVKGGMIAKLDEACAAIAAGVPQVHIVGPKEIAGTLSSPGAFGTLISG